MQSLGVLHFLMCDLSALCTAWRGDSLDRPSHPTTSNLQLHLLSIFSRVNICLGLNRELFWIYGTDFIQATCCSCRQTNNAKASLIFPSSLEIDFVSSTFCICWYVVYRLNLLRLCIADIVRLSFDTTV